MGVGWEAAEPLGHLTLNKKSRPTQPWLDPGIPSPKSSLQAPRVVKLRGRGEAHALCTLWIFPSGLARAFQVLLEMEKTCLHSGRPE